jgi:NitT/TauT family transport system substrate-binding protein
MKKGFLAWAATILTIAYTLTGCGSESVATASENDANTSSSVDELVKNKVIDTDFDLEEAFAKETGVGDPIRIVSTFEGTCQGQAQID